MRIVVATYDDLAGILDLFDRRLNTLLDNIDDLLDKNNELDDETKNSLEDYAKAVDKSLNVYATQRRRQMSKFKELSTVGELQEELRQLFSDIISKYMIVLFDEKKIKDDPLWQYIEKLGRNLRLSAVEALSQERNDLISEEYYMLLNEYLEYWQKTKPERTAYQRMYRLFLEAKKNANKLAGYSGANKAG